MHAGSIVGVWLKANAPAPWEIDSVVLSLSTIKTDLDLHETFKADAGTPW